ncbi:hypothetical protein EB796_015279 [Bugula neritina]|uniref:Uncharacterized protein n=1 Tax=Bugula neritina TaxID=10212 RepID=A0A7J7JJ98_BUGNE|nr:hypothetical protein EB796_015279 [Bugula neritina]
MMDLSLSTPTSSTSHSNFEEQNVSHMKTNQEKIADGVMMLVKPSIEHLDDRVHKVRISQAELSASIDTVGNGMYR